MSSPSKPSEQGPLVSIVIISFNTRQMTMECIESAIKETQSTSYEIIVLDNDSTDGSAEAIEEAFPDVKLIKSKDNYGFARGNNIAATYATGKYLLLLNPDTVVLDRAIDRLAEFAEKDGSATGIWGGKTLFGDRSLNANSCFRRMTLWNQFCRASGLAAIGRNSDFFNSEEYGGWKRDSVKQVDIVCGCFLLLHLDFWKKLGGFDQTFFMYGEEADLCLRAKRYGSKAYITPEATIVHYGGASEAVREDKMVRLLSAKIELIKAHWASHMVPLGAAMLQLWVFNRMVAYNVLKRVFSAKKEKYEQSFSSWKNIWNRRKEWNKGFKKA